MLCFKRIGMWVVVCGAVIGIVADVNVIENNPDAPVLFSVLAAILFTASAVAMLCALNLQWFPKKFHAEFKRGVTPGLMMFGLGWFITVCTVVIAVLVRN